MERVARYGLFVFGGLWFLLKVLLTIVFGDLIDILTSKGARVWLIPMFLGIVGLVIALIHLR